MDKKIIDLQTHIVLKKSERILNNVFFTLSSIRKISPKTNSALQQLGQDIFDIKTEAKKR